MSESENTVVMHGREFVLEEPSTEVVVSILNTVGALSIRAESTAARLVKNPSNRAVLFGLLAAMSEDDLKKLGRAVLQFPGDKEGRKDAQQFFEQGIKVAPIVKAFLINLRLSNDLVEALKAFFDGVGGIQAMLETLSVGASENPTG